MYAVRSVSVFLALTAFAGTLFAAEIDPDLLKALRSNAPDQDPVQIVVHLQGNFPAKELRKLAAGKSQLERGRAIAAAMKKFNEEASRPLRAFLSGSVADGVREVTPLWITNSVRVRATRAVLGRVIAMNGIESVMLDSGKDANELLDDVGNATVVSRDAAKIGWGVEKMSATKAWEAGNKGKGVLVAMIDSGVTIAHPDLAPNIWRNPGETGIDANGNDKATNGIDDDANGYIDDVVGWNFQEKNNEPKDDNGHGTQTAGLVGGMGAGGTQTGVAPKATLMVLRSCCGASNKLFESNTWEAIQYAIHNGARVISMSLSAKHPSKPSYQKWRQVGEVELEAGIIHVNSAGNMGTGREPHNIGAPASNPPAWFHPEQMGDDATATSMITIGASDQSDKVRRYSSGGPVSWQDVDGYGDYPYVKGEKPGLMKPEVCGPSEVPSTSMDGKSYTRSFGGTSSATPQVAGVVALLVAEKAGLTPAQATEALELSAVKISNAPFDNRCGAGRVDAPAAIEYVRTHFE